MMTHPDRTMRLRILLTTVMVSIYLLMLAVQAHAANSLAVTQDEHVVYFSYNTTTLSPAAKHQLDALIKDIQAQGDIHGIRVAGFTDRVGSPTHNEELSRKRAEAVKDYLVSKDVINARVADARWFGDSFSATNCPEKLSHADLIACLQRDRRVEIEFDYSMQVAKAQ